jgi:diguanylate cyclase (GGDEF)-like protein
MKLFSKTSKPEGLDAERLKQSTRTERRNEQTLSREDAIEQADRLHELAVLSLFLHSAGTLEEMLSLFLERAPRVTGAIVSYPLLLDRRREVLTASQLSSVDDSGLEQASIAANENMADLEFPMPVRSYLRDIMDSGEVTVTSNLFEVFGSVLTKEACDQMKQSLNVSKAAVVPLVMEGESFGLSIFLFSDREPDVEVLELAAGHCTLALKALLAGEETTRFGGIDPVTWAHSRGFFLEALEGEVVRARRFGRGLSVIFMDLDDFGEFNESFGHTMGDRVLRSVGMTLASAIALPEIVARYGGDEFAIMLPESHRAMAVELTSELVDKLDTLSVFETDEDGKTGVSASFAIVSYPEDGGSREELLAAAEMSLEQSKEERRAMRMPKRQLTPVQQLRMSGRRRSA